MLKRIFSAVSRWLRGPAKQAAPTDVNVIGVGSIGIGSIGD
jgi:hypothetical protein